MTNETPTKTSAYFRGYISGTLGPVIDRTFDRMGIAEEEISAGKARHPRRAKRIDAVFRKLMPTQPLREKSDDVYRAHARELVERAALGEDLVPPTSAELLCVVLDASLKAPLDSTGLAAAERLFRAVFPERYESVVEEPTPEPWKGAVDELLDGLRRRFPASR